METNETQQFPVIEGTVISPVAGIESVVKTVKVNGTALQTTNHEVDIPVPTKTSDLNNDSDFPTATAVAEAISDAVNSHNSNNESHSDIRQDIASVKTQNVVIETNALSHTVTHNREYIPIVQVVDSSGDVVLADIHHDSANQFTVTVTESINGGKIIYF